jgi:hypothetical protein
VQVPWNSVSPHCNTEGALFRGLVLLHCYSRYSGLQCQGIQSHHIAAAVTVDCSTTELSLCTATAGTICYSTKGLSLMILLLLVRVQQAAVPGDFVCTATTDTVGCSTKGLGLGLLQPVQYAAVPRGTVSATLSGLVTAYRMIAAVY